MTTLLSIAIAIITSIIVLTVNFRMSKKITKLEKRLRINGFFITLCFLSGLFFVFCPALDWETDCFLYYSLALGFVFPISCAISFFYKDLQKFNDINSSEYAQDDLPQKNLIDSIKICYLSGNILEIRFPFLLPTEILQDTQTTLNVRKALQMALIEFFSIRFKLHFEFPVIYVNSQFPSKCSTTELYDEISSQYRGQFAATVLAPFYDNSKVNAYNSVGTNCETIITIVSNKRLYEKIGMAANETQKPKYKVKVKLKTKEKYK